MNWQVDMKELLTLLGRTIYRPQNVLVELAANSYDADSSKVEITSSGESRIIHIKDDGCGMDTSDLDELITIAKSKKRKMLEDGETTPVFKRKLLGCFGIGIVSFLSLGNLIRIFTCKEGCTPIFLSIQKYVDDEGRPIDIVISDPVEDEKFRMHLIDGEASIHGTTIEIANCVLDFSASYVTLRHKLSNLPVGDEFRIFLNESEVRSDDFPSNRWMLKPIEFVLEDIDPNYRSVGQINVYYDMENPRDTLDEYKRGVYLKVHGRVIEENLYNLIRSRLTSPAAVDARIRGLIDADYLARKIQANREDFVDDVIVQKICDNILPFVQSQINDYTEFTSYVSEEAYVEDFRERRDRAIERAKSPHEDLLKTGINFPYEPASEQELVLIIAQLCQLGHLPFKIISTSAGAHIDCLVEWPIEQKKRMPDFVGHLEIETTLDKFFTHQHDYRTKPEICCWSISEREFTRRVEAYVRGRPQSIVDIRLVDPTTGDAEHYGHQKEVHITTQDMHNEQRTRVLRVYVVSEIVSRLAGTHM